MWLCAFLGKISLFNFILNSFCLWSWVWQIWKLLPSPQTVCFLSGAEGPFPVGLWVITEQLCVSVPGDFSSLAGQRFTPYTQVYSLVAHLSFFL